MASQTMPTFTSFSGTATMALGVASAPVPAVVGIITVGMTLRPRDGSSSRAFTVTSPSRMEQSRTGSPSGSSSPWVMEIRGTQCQLSRFCRAPLE